MRWQIFRNVYSQTQQIFQVLDLSGFYVFSRKTHQKLSFWTEDSTTDFIRQIFRSLKQTCVEEEIRNAFMKIEFEFSISVVP